MGTSICRPKLSNSPQSPTARSCTVSLGSSSPASTFAPRTTSRMIVQRLAGFDGVSTKRDRARQLLQRTPWYGPQPTPGLSRRSDSKLPLIRRKSSQLRSQRTDLLWDRDSLAHRITQRESQLAPHFSLGTSSNSSISATSARSFGRPDATLFARRCSRPKKCISSPSTWAVRRPGHASENCTPSTLVITSIRKGGTPSVAMRSGIENSSICCANPVNPNSPSAAQTRCAFSREGSTQKSISPVARGRPCAAKAWAPTTKYLTPWALNKLINSLHSTGRCIVNPKRSLPDCFRGEHPCFDGLTQPMPNLRSSRLLRGSPRKHLLHIAYS